ncbi:MAG: hypothetical protein AVDCRST_MAG64-298, partial [uncultured Phycisphaerae bacterium]
CWRRHDLQVLVPHGVLLPTAPVSWGRASGPATAAGAR